MAQEIIKKDLSLINEDWYEALLEECKSIIVERSLNSRLEIIQGKWEIGKCITEDNDNFERVKIYGKNIMETLSKDLGASSSDLYFCTQFYKQFKHETFSNALENLPKEGKNLSWYKITQKYLGRRDEKLPRTTYKIDEITEAFNKWLEEETFLDEQATNRICRGLELKDNIENFKEYLIKLRK